MRAITGALAAGLIIGLVAFTQSDLASAASAQLPQPLTQWENVPSDTECRVERSYGDPAKPIFLGVHESISGKSFELIVTTASKDTAVLEELPGWISLSGASIERWALHTSDGKGSSIDTFGLTSSEMSKVAAGDAVGLRVNGQPDGDFSLAGLSDALSQLDQCIARLRQVWRVDEPDSAVGIKGPRGDVRTPFASEAPTWWRLHLHRGKVQFVVLVDESGKIAGCDVQETAGSPLLEELGCELILRDVKAEPARDRTGQPVKDSFRSPPIVN